MSANNHSCVQSAAAEASCRVRAERSEPRSGALDGRPAEATQPTQTRAATWARQRSARCTSRSLRLNRRALPILRWGSRPVRASRRSSTPAGAAAPRPPRPSTAGDRVGRSSRSQPPPRHRGRCRRERRQLEDGIRADGRELHVALHQRSVGPRRLRSAAESRVCESEGCAHEGGHVRVGADSILVYLRGLNRVFDWPR
jgi:hypothetical protein